MRIPPVSHSGKLVDALILQSNLVFLSLSTASYTPIFAKLLCLIWVCSQELHCFGLSFYTSSLLNRFFPPIYVFQHSLQPYCERVEAISSNSSQLVGTCFKAAWAEVSCYTFGASALSNPCLSATLVIYSLSPSSQYKGQNTYLSGRGSMKTKQANRY